ILNKMPLGIISLMSCILAGVSAWPILMRSDDPAVRLLDSSNAYLSVYCHWPEFFKGLLAGLYTSKLFEYARDRGPAVPGEVIDSFAVGFGAIALFCWRQYTIIARYLCTGLGTVGC